ncbi:acyltransferase family protein [Marinimicrobium sp. ABcell2]|uniref:acyltransferase family protein n=1 Tax=Marinimicrobium sp. ABcell2 TaxID=3069751 RepID=UPI0027B6DCF0|nr:acyltransferase family protein [Marinimicrobium sp. ABcell2]MDQ2076161.1 acyltransferase family protein [Marinimicrobium sp. ABcell2]
MTSGEGQQRPYYHDIDILRGFLMSLGILLHAAFYLSPNPLGPYINVGVESPVYQYLIDVIMLFRMEAFFLVAGFFAAMLAERYSLRHNLTRRAARLLVPMLVCGLTFNLIIGFLAWPGEFERSPLSGHYWLSGLWLEHLWFLPILFVYGAAYQVLHHFTAVLQLRPTFKFPVPLLLLLIYLSYPVLVFLFHRVGWRLDVWPWGRSLFGLFWMPHLITYIPDFLLGVVLWKLGALRAITTGAVLWLHGSLALLGMYLFFAVDGAPSTWVRILFELSEYAVALPLAFLSMGAFAVLFARPGAWGKYLADASYTLYLLHMPVLACVAFYFYRVGAPSVHVAFAIFCVLTLVVGLVSHHFIQKSRAAAFLLNGKLT